MRKCAVMFCTDMIYAGNRALIKHVTRADEKRSNQWPGDKTPHINLKKCQCTGFWFCGGTVTFVWNSWPCRRASAMIPAKRTIFNGTWRLFSKINHPKKETLRGNSVAVRLRCMPEPTEDDNDACADGTGPILKSVLLWPWTTPSKLNSVTIYRPLLSFFLCCFFLIGD